nr:MAG TPA: hypothetical protein [Caudoviricetes sp.]
MPRANADALCAKPLLKLTAKNIGKVILNLSG